jgi:hypothetical protein
MKVPAAAVGKTTACVKCGERIRIGAPPKGAAQAKASAQVSGTAQSHAQDAHGHDTETQNGTSIVAA